MTITQMILNKTAKGRPGKTIKPKGLVIHWTANTGRGANAWANRNYFNTTDRAASAHYIVDDKEIIQCLPENEMAYHVGANSYKSAALQRLSRYPNDCTIGIEICVNSDGNFEKALRNAVELAADICHRYGWNRNNLWRHYDITGKDCPKFFVDNPTAVRYGFSSAAGGWERFKADVECLLADRKEDDDLKEVYVDFEGKLASSKGGINEAGKLCVPIVELIEKFNLPLVANFQNGKGYVRRKREGEK